MPTQETNPEPTDQPSAAVCASPAGVPVPEQAVQTPDFVEQHRPALEQDEVRHNLILANLGRLAAGHPPDLLRWTLGAPGACAVQTPGYPIVLGELTRAQCRALADQTRDLDYPGVVGPDRTAQWSAVAVLNSSTPHSDSKETALREQGCGVYSGSSCTASRFTISLSASSSRRRCGIMSW